MHMVDEYHFKEATESYTKCSVRGGIYAVGRAHVQSLKVFLSPYGMVQVHPTEDGPPFKKDCIALSTPLTSR